MKRCLAIKWQLSVSKFTRFVIGLPVDNFQKQVYTKDENKNRGAGGKSAERKTKCVFDPLT